MVSNTEEIFRNFSLQLTGSQKSNVVQLRREVEVFVQNNISNVELPGDKTHQCNIDLLCININVLHGS